MALNIERSIDWKAVLFTLAVALLFIPMVYLGVNTFFPDAPVNNCYETYPSKAYPIQPTPAEQAAEEMREKEQRQCERDWQTANAKYEGWKYVVIMIICVVASIGMLFPFDRSITYGLFVGVVLTAFTGTIRYLESRSVLGFALMVALFALIIGFIQKQRKATAAAAH